MGHRQTLLACAATVIATGCMVGPDYKRPDVFLPPDYRSADAVPTAANAPVYGDLAWWTVFTDPDLQELIRTALKQNYDVRIAAARILQAQSQVTIARAPIFPTVDGSVTGPYNAYTGSERPLPDSIFQPQAGFDVAWELDIWGKYRRGTEAAQAQLLASEDFRYGVIATLVAEVGQAYLTLRALDLTLEISNRTVASRKQSLELVNARLEGGVAGILDVRQAETLLYTATKTIPDTQRQIEQQENFINILLGQNPGPVKRGRPLEQQIAAPALPPGLPTELLTRRPDIRAAEQQLVAANAQIGVAKSLLYPQVTISGFRRSGQFDDQRLELRTVRGIQRIACDHPADLQRRPLAGQRRLQRGHGAGSGRALSADAAAGTARGVGLIDRRSQAAGVSRAAGIAGQRADGCQPGREHAVRRRGVQLPGSSGYRAPAVRRRTRSCPGAT